MAEVVAMQAGYQGARILITGANGYIAGCLTHALSGTDCLVRRFSRAPFPTAGTVARIEDTTGDPAAPETWRRALIDIDIVLHCAGQTSVYAAAKDPAADMAANAGITLAMLEAARDCTNRPSFVLASTATLVGLPATLPVDEDTPVAPVTAYDVSKLAAEQYLALYARLGIVAGGALRLANVFGPGPSSGSADRGVLNKIVAKALRGESIPIFRPGDWLRDYIHIDDVVRAFLMAGLAAPSLGGQAFYVCSGTSVTLADAFARAVEAAAKVTGTPVELTPVDPPAGLSAIEFRHFVGRFDRLRDATGWSPQVTLGDGLDRMAASLAG